MMLQDKCGSAKYAGGGRVMVVHAGSNVTPMFAVKLKGPPRTCEDAQKGIEGRD